MLRTTDEAYTRLVQEQKELDYKITRLDLFVNQCRHHKRSDVSLDELHLLEEQLQHMIAYNSILVIRIHRIEECSNGQD